MYALDYFFATKPAGKAIMLIAICALMTALGGFLYFQFAIPQRSKDLPESLWTAWTFIADSGAHASEDTFRKRLVAVPISIGGMFFFALLVGLMTDAVASKVDQLSKGESRVLEENHTLIIGWTKKTIPLVKELAIANKTRGNKRSIVILGDAPKEEMDGNLKQNLPLPDRFGTKVVTRSGSATSIDDLKLCSASLARTIVVLSPALSPLKADAIVIQTCTLLANSPEIRADIIAELAELDHVSELQGIIGTLLPFGQSKMLKASTSPYMSSNCHLKVWLRRRRKMVPVATGDMALRIMVKRALEPGTVEVLKELLQFEGCEFRLKYWPELVGRKFSEMIFLFPDAIPCGLRKTLPSGQSCTLVNPPPGTVIEEGDRLLVISENDESYKPAATLYVPPHVPSLTTKTSHKKPSLNVLIVGWRNDLDDVLHLIDSSVSRGSQVTVLSIVKPQELLEDDFKLKHASIRHIYGDPLSLKVLKELPVEAFDKVIILMDEDKGPDLNNTAVTAMFIRHIQIERGRKDSTIVAELPTLEDTALQEVHGAWLDDTVDPDYLQAMVLANLAEDVDVGSVLDKVVGDSQNTMVLQQVTSYLQDDVESEKLTFWELQARAVQKGEIIVAHKCAANGNQWVTNPPNKSEKLAWVAGDELLVLPRASS
ncbi:hypothetical protein SELMODRAFT_155112 [Selaginella moellendorffii]|uniref:CASTOR/POLLUX/SYM8 ion channel conserved domain-containing protein n=1 Tax=Selaginella moellendorffii TaxID=88036 RepID=D8SGE5_SELML|nr:hypothetical protein SELMODRAFT_155112 [Selaginella moellendorffii]